MKENTYTEIPNRNEKYKCAIIGCTGVSGQQFLEALDGHPWFEISSLHGHSNIGLAFHEARRGCIAKNLSENILNRIVEPISSIDNQQIDIIFSAIPGSEAQKIEGELAKEKPVISTASFYRYESNIPIFLPIVNANHAKLIKFQQEERNWKGFICPGPNCTTVGASIALYPIYKNYGLKSVHLVSMQAISGAGYPGTPSYDILGNIIPYIPNEENKVILEIKKIFADIRENGLQDPIFEIDAKCNRVPVIDGHIESLFFETIEETNVEEIQYVLESYRGEPSHLGLPSASVHPIVVFDELNPDRPQPRIDLNNSTSQNGMQTFVGGISKSNFRNGFKMTVLSHNAQLGAGRGGVLSAEYLVRKGIIG